VKENFQDTAAPLIEHFRRRAREAR
jgi:hypothetical protein